MITKSLVEQSIKNLPDSFSVDQLIEQLVFMEKISKGIEDSEENRTISNQEMKNIIDGWSS